MRLGETIGICAVISCAVPLGAGAQTGAPVKGLYSAPLPAGSAQAPAKSLKFDISPQPNRVLQSKSGAIKGAIIGGGIGAVLGPTIGAESCPENKKYQCVLKAGVTLGAVGALIGWLK